MNKRYIKVLGFLIVVLSVSIALSDPYQTPFRINTKKYEKPIDSLPYPIKPRNENFFNDPNAGENNMDLNDPSIIEQNVTYDPNNNEYIIEENIGEDFYQNPSFLSFEEYLEQQNKKSLQDFWKQRSNTDNVMEGKGEPPTVYRGNELFDRIFGGTNVDIRPSGNVDLTLGYSWQRNERPDLLESMQKTGNPDFDMNINLNVIGKIGEKLKLNTAYNTQATFNFENQVKLEYSGNEDQIIQKLEAGNVSMQSKSQLIQGSQTLLGFKTQLKFGKLMVSTILAQQQSKTENIRIEGGAQTRNFELLADQYEDNRHFFLGQYFRNGNPANGREGFEYALKNPPVVNSLFQITRMEAWVTNSRNVTENTREVVAFADLGENKPFSNVIASGTDLLPSNQSNNLFSRLVNAGNATRSIDNVVATLTGPGFNLQPVQDFERSRMYKLNDSEFSYNPKLGYISLNVSLKPFEVLAVAYQYTYNGKVYQVGEFSQDVPVDTSGNKVLYLKLLKSTSLRTNLPMFDLMMKNIYSLGAYQVNKEDFRLDVVYMDPGGGEKRYLPEGVNTRGVPLISILGLDKLNFQNDPESDGIFDFNETTINTVNGRIIFPVLEPFGSNLRKNFAATEPDLANRFAYDSLYRTSKAVALQFPEKNRYKIKGTYKSSVSNEVSIGAFNVPKGSVKVMAGGQVLKENIDYSIDYNIGKVKILNDGILNSGVPINISYEDPALIGFQLKRLLGTRLDYAINKDFNLGATYMQLSERPFTRKVNIGDDPINNRIIGIDGSYTTQAPFLTRWVDKLPFFSTKEKSIITVNAEAAKFIPGHSRFINSSDKEGQIYLDDFEGAATEYDLKFPQTAWVNSSTPSKATNALGQILFPEADSINSYQYNKNRARASWYTIAPEFFNNNNQTPANIVDNEQEQRNPYTRQYSITDVFPNSSVAVGQTQLATFDVRFDPTLRGVYNLDTVDVNTNGTLSNHRKKWGGLMRSIDYNDFENANVQFISLWMLDPFLLHQDSGYLYLNLGSISEDILKDSRQFYENAIPADGNPNRVDTTRLGLVPNFPPITNNFDNNPDVRTAQDVGLDGFDDATERIQYADFLTGIQSKVNSSAFSALNEDPSSDNFHHYRGDDYDAQNLGILSRYQRYNGPQANSPVTQANQDFINSSTQLPDMEDLNRDFTLNETEEYYQYKIKLAPNMAIGTNFITDTVSINYEYLGNDLNLKFYRFLIPINAYDQKVGGIQDFRSIRFVRMYLTGFDTSVVCRFARMELIRNQWRDYNLSLLSPGEYLPDDQSNTTYFNTGAVNIEENSNKTPIPYILPPGIQREYSIGTQPNLQQNEQALSMKTCNLQDGDSRAIFKTLNLDLRNYKRLRMFVHGEALAGSNSTLNDNDLSVFIRLGADFNSNYYEFEIPLKVTAAGSTKDVDIWPLLNNFDVLLDSLTSTKMQRNAMNAPYYLPFSVTDAIGRKISVVGSPELGRTAAVMLGVRNPKNDGTHADDGKPKCAEIWWNELRLSGFDEKGGYAALARAEIKLADLATVNLSGNMHTQGFGGLEQKIAERYRDNFVSYDANTSIDLGRFLPKSTGIKLPVFAGYQKNISRPQFDPFDTDIKLKDKVKQAEVLHDKKYADSLKQIALTTQTIKSINITNVRKERKPNAKVHIWDIENINASYAYNQLNKTSPILENDKSTKHTANIAYNYSIKPKYLQPFSKAIKSDTKYLKWLREFNLNIVPSEINVSSEWSRNLGELRLRKLNNDPYPIKPSYIKNFVWERNYGLKFDLTKSIKVDYTATNQSRIDERRGAPRGLGLLDTLAFADNYEPWGRTTNFNQSANASYQLPIEKLPFLDWVKIRTSYGTSYNWIGAARSSQALSLKNTISNTQNKQVNGEFDFKKLYDQIPFIKEYNKSQFPASAKKEDKPGSKGIGKTDEKDKDGVKTKNGDKTSDKLDQVKVDVPKDKTGKKDKDTKDVSTATSDKEKPDTKATKTKTPHKANAGLAVLIKPLISLKKITVNYTETGGITLPGFQNRPKYFGFNPYINQMSPGATFAFGAQPDTSWLSEIARQKWITPDTMLSNLFLKNKSKDLSIKAQFEPYYDLKLDVNMTYNYTKNHTELFKVKENSYQHLTPLDKGSFSISYFTLPTMFEKQDKKNYLSKLFTTFENNRSAISTRLANDNPGYNSYANDTLGGLNHYGIYQQDVLIPAFLSAYTGKDPNAVKMNVFSYLPKPNWRLTYTGLSNIPGLKNTIQSINISHAYTNTLSVGSFISNLYYADSLGYQYNYDTLSGNFYPVYNIPMISINEQLSPLIGVDIAFKKPRLNTKFEWKKSRNLGMSFIDYQLIEAKTNDFTVGVGYKVKGVTLKFIKVKDKPLYLKNDVNFRLDISYRDNFTVNRKLDQQIQEPTKGMKTIRIAPSIDYMINQQLNVKLFYERTQNIPATSASPRMTMSRAGLLVRFTLGQ